MQAIGLLRWVFAVPALAKAYVDPVATEAQRAALEVGFNALNLWGGVGIGEHLGQILTCLWLGMVAAQHWEGRATLDRIGNCLAILAVLGIGIGLGESLSVALGTPVALFSLFTIIGYLAFSGWLIALGLSMLRSPQSVLRQALI